MSSFACAFSEPFWFTNGSYMLSGSYTKDEALEIFAEGLGDDIDDEAMNRGWVRFGYPPENIEDREGLPKSCWFTCKQSKGAKEVWCIG